MKKTTRLLPGWTLTLLILLVTVSGAPAWTTSNASPDSKYRVFCSSKKIEVEQRTLEQQKNARGSDVCLLGEFDYLSDAEKYAEKFGGKGADCSCN